MSPCCRLELFSFSSPNLTSESIAVPSLTQDFIEYDGSLGMLDEFDIDQVRSSLHVHYKNS